MFNRQKEIYEVQLCNEEVRMKSEQLCGIFSFKQMPVVIESYKEAVFSLQMSHMTEAASIITLLDHI